MKHFTINMIFAAAALLGAHAAQAATSLRAEVPFRFSMNGKEFRPGTYELRSDSRPVQLILQSLENHGGALAFYTSEELPQNAGNRKSKLIFQCTDGACALVDVLDSNSGVRLRLAPPKIRKGRPASIEGNTIVTVDVP